MSSTVSYSVVSRKNPSDQEAAPKFYAQAQASGDVTIREMCARIQQMCTVTRADVMAVLASLEDVMVESLAKGEIVRLGDLGSFQVGLSGNGAETEDKYDSSFITKARINFRPAIALSTMLMALKFTKVNKLPVKKEEEAPKAPAGV